MRTKKDWAKFHAANGFWVFRIGPNGKKPRYKGWQLEATRDAEEIDALWSGRDADCNIGAYTSKFKDQHLIVVDVDNKGDKNGDDTMFELDMGNCPFPLTAENHTPTGGRHVIYTSPQLVKQGANVLGQGLDIRARGGYIVMAGSTIDGRPYTWHDADIVAAPDWLFSKLLLATNVAPKQKVDKSKIDPVRARDRATTYLEDAPIPEQGERNDTAFKVACRVKDCGVEQDVCMELMIEWNNSLEEPLEDHELETLVGSAYASGQNEIGSKAAEVIFEKVEKADGDADHPFNVLNKEFALCIAGGGHHILWETTNEKGGFKLEHLNEPSFHKMLSYKTIEIDNKRKPISKLWIDDPMARRYEGLVFAPQKEIDPRFYNMWRGFAYKPLEAGEEIKPEWKKSLDQFLEHALMNVCNGDEKLFNWLIGYFAHMIQRPWEKPLTALVFKGLKGTGKNALIERVAALISPHYIIADDRRYLTSNFNGHFEACLLMVLDEAFWSGDKESEGKLKGLITGAQHNIEHKGKEGFKVDNLTRVVILGNEDWLVPATHDERRFGVFTVGNGRRKDKQFFLSMKRRMEDGGYRLLLTYLLNFDISEIDVDDAPMTIGLVEQKHASLEPLEQWWLDCLSEGRLVGSAARGINFKEIHTETFRNAFTEYSRRRGIRARLPDERGIGRSLLKVAPTLIKKRKRVGGELEYFYYSDGLNQLRRDWEKFVGSPWKWNDYDNGDLECLQ